MYWNECITLRLTKGKRKTSSKSTYQQGNMRRQEIQYLWVSCLRKTIRGLPVLEFYKRQEQRDADRVEIKDGSSFLDQMTYDSLPLTRWLDKSGKPIEDHPELPADYEAKEILKRNPGMPMEIMLKSKIVRETLKVKGYDLDEVETGRVAIGEDLRMLLEKLAEDKPVVRNNDKDKREVTILKRKEAAHGEDSKTGEQPDDKEIVRTLFE